MDGCMKRPLVLKRSFLVTSSPIPPYPQVNSSIPY
jgi:hypothetical protein